jgi:hypothetical protein
MHWATPYQPIEDRMANNTLGQTAQEFRAAVRQATERNQMAPQQAAPPVDANAIAAAVEARVADTVRREISQQVGAPVDRAVRSALAEQMAPPIDPALVARLESAAKQLPQGDDEVLLHLRNILPGQMRQEMHQQNQQLLQRMAMLEEQLDAVQADNGLGRDLVRLALTGLVVAVIVIFVAIFERQLQNWGRDAIYPIFGVSIKEVPAATPPSAMQTAPRQVK